MQKQKKTESKSLKLFDLVVYLVIAVCAVALVVVLATRTGTDDPAEVPVDEVPGEQEDAAAEEPAAEPETKPEPEEKPELTWADAEDQMPEHGVIYDTAANVTTLFYEGQVLAETMSGKCEIGETSLDGSVSVVSGGGAYALLIREELLPLEAAAEVWLSRDGALLWYATADGGLYRMNVADRTAECVAEGLAQTGFVVSPSGAAVIYQTSELMGQLWTAAGVQALPEGMVGISVTDDAALVYGTMTDAESGDVMLYAYAPETQEMKLLGETKNVDHFTNAAHDELFFTDGKYTWYTPDGETVYDLGSYMLCEPVGEMRMTMQAGAAMTVYVESLRDTVLLAVPHSANLDMKAELYRITEDYAPEQIAMQVDFYSMRWNAGGESLYYIKNDCLYRMTKAEGFAPRQVASAVVEYDVSEDGALLVILDSTDAIFAIHEDGALRVDRDVMGGMYIGGDGRRVYYEKAGAEESWQKDLYVCRVTEEPELLDSNMGGLVVEDGYVKYTRYLENAAETVVFAEADGARFTVRTERQA